MAENKIFRKVSLDRLSSPEELDQRLTVISPIGWMALAAVGILVFAALVWGVFGRISDKAAGSGILISGGGIASVVHHAAGQITDISVRDGDYVVKGQVLARLEQTQLIADINQNKEDLVAAQAIDLDKLELNDSRRNFNVYSRFGEIYKNYLAAQANLNTQRKYYGAEQARAEHELEQARIQYETGLDTYNDYKILYEHGAVSKAELEQAERAMRAAESSYNTVKQNELPLAQLREAEAAFEAQKQWLQDSIVASIIELENNIQKQQRELLNNNEIIAGVSGRVLEMQVRKGDLYQAGNVVCTIAAENEQNELLEAVLYVPAEQGKKIIPGMEVNISPTTVQKEESGFMLGNVIAVSEYPASAQGMLLTLGNADLVRQLSGNSSPIEVRVKLVMDSSTVSGYKWSTPRGPSIVIDGGTFCTAEVKIEQKRPLSMVMPFIKRLLPI